MMGPATIMQGIARLAEGIPDEVQRLAGWAWGLLPFDAGSRLHWTGLAAFFLLGAGAWVMARRQGHAEGKTGLADFLIPRHIYFSQSSLVDVKVYFANRLLAPVTIAAGQGLTIAIAATVAGLAAPLIHSDAGMPPSLSTIIAMTILVTIASDFAVYWTHRLHHEHPILWPFHKVHHSAEHLTPLTVFRKHPVYDMISAIIRGACVGPLLGLIFAGFGVVNFYTILGVSLVPVFFNMVGANFRHSHIWIDFGPAADRIFISPAQHQIHHSCAPEHHDRNYGEIFALWDWMFGTLYIPEGRETLVFGVADASGVREAQVHTSLASAYMVPFAEAAEAMRARGASGGVMAE
ncbi:conserved hypothetical protein [Hyphomonas neptunium ATCC 15444]|uniref:Fatty acid hydroxylase domain-containing protein n=3 Tax=Hyphomonadaceae TaxID=69657 RepID=Q0C4K8_HYPNA|nr:conserved hypothetical protein [Hyphomonas neptunium ATCC 15444]